MYSINKKKLNLKTIQDFINSININNNCPFLINTELKNKKRIIAIGDLHGDFDALLIALSKAKVINKFGKWIGKDTIVVQVGDILDAKRKFELGNGTEEINIINYLTDLHKQAFEKNGGVYLILGNHEIMNVQGDFRYVTKNALNKFSFNNNNRRNLFKPGGKLAKFLACNFQAILKIDEWIFVHGGILKEHLENFTLNKINNIIRNILLGNKNIKLLKKNQYDLLLGGKSIFWTRALADDNVICNNVYNTLKILKANKGGIVIGHTPSNHIISKCKKKIWRIDTHMSQA